MAAQRGKNFTSDELKQLCHSYLEISQDPCIGSGQKYENFWERIAEHYNKNKASGLEHRSTRSLECKWSDVRKDTARFIACYEAAEDLHTSGTNAEDLMDKAKELFKQRNAKGKDFMLIPCFYILKGAPGWMKLQKKVKNTIAMKQKSEQIDLTFVDNGMIDLEEKNNSPSVVHNIEESPNSNDGTFSSALKLPMGCKAAKEKVKKLKYHEDTARVAAEAQKLMAETARDHLKVAEKAAETAQERLRIAEKAVDSKRLFKLLNMPIGNLDPEIQAYMTMWRMEEVTKLKLKMELNAGASSDRAVASRTALPIIAPVEDAEDSAHVTGENTIEELTVASTL